MSACVVSRLACMELFDVVDAEFRPTRTDDLKPGAVTYIGQRLTWCASWVIGEEDNPAYAGDFAMVPVSDEPLPFAWVPQSDLVPAV